MKLDKIKIDQNEKRIPSSSKIKYSLGKSKFSKQIIDYISTEDLQILDLKQKITLLNKTINEWSFIEN